MGGENREGVLKDGRGGEGGDRIGRKCWKRAVGGGGGGENGGSVERGPGGGENREGVLKDGRGGGGGERIGRKC